MQRPQWDSRSAQSTLKGCKSLAQGNALGKDAPPLRRIAQRFVFSFLGLTLMLLLAAGTARAATYSWTNTVSGNWSTAVKWDTTPVSASDTILNFNQAGTYTATNDITAGFLLNQLNFNGPTLTLAGNSLAFTNNGGTLPQINQNGSTAVTITNTLSLATNLTFGGSGTGLVTVTGFIGTGSTTGSLAHVGAGVLYLNNTNNGAFNGGIIVSNATLKATCGSATTAFGVDTTTWSGPQMVLYNSTLIFDGGGWLKVPIAFSGTNTLMASTGGNPYLNWGGLMSGTGKIIVGGANGMAFCGRNLNYTCDVVIAQAPGGYILCGDSGTPGSFGYGPLTFASTNGARLGVNNSNGANLRNNPVILQTNLWRFGNYGNDTFHIYGNIIGPGSLGKEYDAGDVQTSLNLYGTNTYSGGTIWLSGYLRPYNTGSLGVGPVTMGGKASSSHAVTLANMAAITLTNNFTLIGITNSGSAWNPQAQTEFNTAFNLTLSGSVSGSGGLLKTGAGTLTIPGSSTFSGPVTVAGGIMNFNGYPVNNAAVFMTGGIMQNATLTAAGYVFSGGTNNANLAGSAVLTINGGNTTLFGANTFTGGTMINSGSVSFMTTNARPASGTITVVSGATLGLGVGGAGYFVSSDLDAVFAGTMPNVSMSAGSLVGIDTTAGNFTYTSTGPASTRGLNKLGANTLTLSGANIYSGGTLITAGTLKLTAANNMPNGGAVTVAGGILDLGTYSPSVGAVTMTSGVISNGTLTGTSYTFSGGTVNAVLAGSGIAVTNIGGTTTLNALSGVNTFNGGLVVNGGTLAIDFVNQSANVINSGNVLTLGGGTLTLTGKSGTIDSQTFASTTMTASRSSTISLNLNSATSLTVALGAITRNTGSLLNFSSVPNTTTVMATTTTGNNNGILGPWATSSSGVNRQYVMVNANYITNYSSATATAQPATLSDVNNANANYSFSAGASMTGPITANTLRYTGAAATLANGGNTITLNSLLCAGSGALVVSGAGNLVIGANKELVLYLKENWSNITCPIVDNGGGASAVTILMDNVGELSFTGTNTFSGGFTASGGGQIDYGPSSFGSGPMTVSGVSLQGSGTQTNSVTCLNGARLRNGITFTGPIFLKDTTYTGWSFDGTTVNLYGTISGPGGLSQTAGTLTLKGTNTYSGGTTVANNGTLALGNTNALGTGPLYFSNGGVLTTTADTTGGSGITNSMVLLLDGTINCAYNMLLSGVISGYANLIKSGNSNLILSAANTFYGNTLISAGLLVVTNSLALQNSTLFCNNLSARTNISFAAGNANYTLGGLIGTNNLVMTNQTGAAIDLNVGNNLGIGSRYDGVLSGAGKLTKVGCSTFTLTATNTYTGSTIVSNGTLYIASSGAIPASSNVTVSSGATLMIENTGGAIPDAATVYLSGRMSLASGVNEAIGTLCFGTTNMWAGSWGSSSSAATFKNDTYFAGSGTLNVISGMPGIIFEFK